MRQFKVQGMSCAHCVRAITAAITALDAAAQVEVDLAAAQVQVESVLSDAQLQAAIEQEGYSVENA